MNSLDHDEQKNVNELRDLRLQNQMKTVKEFSLNLHNRNTWIEALIINISINFLFDSYAKSILTKSIEAGERYGNVVTKMLDENRGKKKEN